MSRTGLSAADLAKQFRDECGDGSVEWVYTPIQTWVLLDAADMLDENAKLRELVRDMWRDGMCECDERGACAECEYHFPDRMRELGIEVGE